MSLKKKERKKVHLVGLHWKLTDVRAKKGPPLHFPPQWMQLAPSGRVGEDLPSPNLANATRCLSRPQILLRGGCKWWHGGSVCPNRNVISPEAIASAAPLVPVQPSGRDGQMCSDRSLLLSLSTCPSASIVPGCQGAEWRLLSRAQV